MKRIAHLLLIAVALSCGGFAVVASAPAEADAEIIDRIVARINDEIVTFYELKQATTPFLLQNGMQPSVLDDPERRQEIYQKVLDELVDRRLLLQEADKLELSVSDQEVDQWLAYTRKQQKLSEEQFRQMIERYGMSYESYREMIRQNLLKIRMVKVKVGSQVSISDEQVEKAYRDRFGEGGAKSKFIDVSHILIRPEAETEQAAAQARREAEEALGKLRAGADFAQVAGQHSDGPSSKKGGKLGAYSRGELDPQFEKAAFNLEPGEVSDVVRTKFGFHVIKVDDVEYKAGANADERKAKLRAELQQKAVERQLQAYLQKLRSRSFVQVDF